MYLFYRSIGGQVSPVNVTIYSSVFTNKKVITLNQYKNIFNLDVIVCDFTDLQLHIGCELPPMLCKSVLFELDITQLAFHQIHDRRFKSDIVFLEIIDTHCKLNLANIKLFLLLGIWNCDVVLSSTVQ